MIVPKAQVLNDAPSFLNQADRPWYVTVEGDAIVARWKWMDALFFAPAEVSNETRDYAFIVTLKDNGKFKEQDKGEEKTSSVSFENGQLSFGTSKSSFSGKKTEKSIQFGLGRDNQTGQVGLVGFKFDTNQVKEPIRAFLASAGYKKAGLFG